MIRLLSYIYPITKKIESTYNGTLEITWFNGKKLLNTKNANYSYGSLEKILKIGLDKIDVNQFKNVLLLGLGGGNVIKTLQQKKLYKGKITAIEIDPVIVQVAKEEFGIFNTDKVTIHCTDAYQFVLQNKEIFDFIIIDLFLDDTIPLQFFDDLFWSKLTTAQQLLFNGSLHDNNKNQLQNSIKILQKANFNINKLENVNKTNILLLANK